MRATINIFGNNDFNIQNETGSRTQSIIGWCTNKMGKGYTQCWHRQGWCKASNALPDLQHCCRWSNAYRCRNIRFISKWYHQFCFNKMSAIRFNIHLDEHNVFRWIRNYYGSDVVNQTIPSRIPSALFHWECRWYEIVIVKIPADPKKKTVNLAALDSMSGYLATHRLQQHNYLLRLTDKNNKEPACRNKNNWSEWQNGVNGKGQKRIYHQYHQYFRLVNAYIWN